MKNENGMFDARKNENNLVILYTNADQFLNKRHELINLITEKNPDIIHITETLPKRKNSKLPVNDCEFDLPGYSKPFINKNPSRGVAFYIKENIDVQLCTDGTESDLIESVFCTVNINQTKILIGCVYRSDSYDIEKSTQELIAVLKNMEKIKHDKIWITGDFNYPDINWQTENDTIKVNEMKFVDCLKDMFLSQKITKPTRHRTGQKSNLLDLCLTDDDLMISNIEHLPPLGKSDHEVLLISLDIRKKVLSSPKPKFNFYKTDFTKLKEYVVSQDWKQMNDMDLDTASEFLKNTLHEGFKKFVPLTNNRNKKFKQPVWMNKKALKCIKKKYTLYKRYLTSKLHYDYQRYLEIRNETKRQIRRAVKDYEKNIAKSCKVNSKRVWKYVNSKLKRQTGISNLKMADGGLTKTDKDKADVINTFFSSVFTKENTESVPQLNSHNNNLFLSDLILTQEAVKKKLEGLNPNKAMGPDEIPSIVLKELSSELSFPLLIIFNKSLSEGRVPIDWKTAEVKAIFKKGDKTDPGNYRPVSLTNVVCKILESFVTDEIRKHMETNNLFTQCQHGFRQHRSCVTQLLEVLNDFTNLIENKDSIDVIYLDFSKAFDTVPHLRLINKLEAYGIQGNMIKWIKHFLSDRKQRVKVNSEYSEYTPVISGIPQGSILGPVLFVIYINDLPEIIKSSCKIFADDTKLYSSPKDKDILQADLLSLLKWSDKWQLKFNISKCGILHIGTNNPKFDYYMDNDMSIKLKEVSSEKDVGVTFSDNLKFDIHINNIVNKANQMVGIIKRSFTYLDKDMFLLLYKALVRPHLEYANVIWHPTFKRQSIMIEKVQRRATKILKEIANLEYKDRLISLKLPSLKYRRTRGDLIETYKILHTVNNVNPDNFFKLMPQSSTTRNSTFKIYKEYAKSTPRCNFLSNRIINLWNSLSVQTKLAPDLVALKRNIDLELQDILYEHD